MEISTVATIETYFAGLEDPRSEINRHHKLLDILVIAIIAVICGANDWVAVETFSHAKYEWLKTFLELPNGNHRTTPFGGCFASWIRSNSSYALAIGSQP